VIVQVTINTDGHVETAVAVSGPPLLRAAAEAAAKRATFAPKVLSGGQRIKVSGVLNYEFELKS
jgi:TonB family protein